MNNHTHTTLAHMLCSTPTWTARKTAEARVPARVLLAYAAKWPSTGWHLNFNSHQQHARGPVRRCSYPQFTEGETKAQTESELCDSRTRAVHEPLMEQATKQAHKEEGRDWQRDRWVTKSSWDSFPWSHILTLWLFKRLHMKTLNRQIAFTTMGISWAPELEKLGWLLNLTHSPQFPLFFWHLKKSNVIFIR